MEQEDRAADQILQMFMFNMDERIKAIESHTHKNDLVLDKLMEKSHVKFKRLRVPVRCPECGHANGPDVEMCKGCGLRRAAEKVEKHRERHQNNKALVKFEKDHIEEKQREHAVKILNIVFD